MTETERVNSEWVALNAFRGLTKIAAKGDLAKATYDNALQLGGELYPELLGPDTSLLRRVRESDTVKEYRQRAAMKSIQLDKTVTALALLTDEITDLKAMVALSKRQKDTKARVDQLKRKLAILVSAEAEISPVAHTENQLIFRDALSVDRIVPPLRSGKAYRDFELPDSNVLRVRVLHPDRPEHVTGADIIYEKHSPSEDCASIVAVQYKIWENKILYLGDRRMQGQLERLRKFVCDNKLCEFGKEESTYRFPCCAAFLRPTDKLQRADQSFVSSGEHLPICRIDQCKSTSMRGKDILEYKKMRGTSLSSEMFEQLFNKGKIGSRYLAYAELARMYKQSEVAENEDTVIIYAQEFADHLSE